MLMLLFFAVFGFKKSTLLSYSLFWDFKIFFNSVLFFNYSQNNFKQLFFSRFQFTSVTSNLTSIILFLF